MDHYKQGKATRQGHKAIPEGCFEEEQGLKGFYGPVSHLIKKHPSTRWTSIEGPLKPRMFDLAKLISSSDEKLHKLLYNQDCTLYLQSLKSNSPKTKEGFRNADGDFIYFCHKGGGKILTEYGVLNYKKSDYIVIPKCLVHTFVPEEDSDFFIVENLTSHYQEPERGLLGRHALYDENALQKPKLEPLEEEVRKNPILKILVKKAGKETSFSYSETIYDVIGWKGDLYPFVLSMDHIMPVTSHRAHLPPSVHTTFVAREFVVCSFLPRPLEQDSDALKVPFYHQNIDYDEVIFYHAGDFFSRDNLHEGMMSLHPQGFPHGPHPKAFKSVSQKTTTSEYAVMVDSRKQLLIHETLNSVEWKDYWKSWKA